MFKKLTITMVLIVTLATPVVSHAAFQDELRAQIQSLLRIVSSLQQQLSSVSVSNTSTVVVSDFDSCVAADNAVMESYPRQCAHNGRTYVEVITSSTEPNIPASVCPSLSRSLYVGTRGEDVANLQLFLRAAGVYSHANITGYYGEITQRAVQQWQAQQGIVNSGNPYVTGFGVVGPVTRTAIIRYCGGGSGTPLPEPTVCTLQYDPVCGRTPGICVDRTDGGYCTDGEIKTYGNSCQLKAAGAQFLYEGQCRDDTTTTAPNNCRIWNDGCNTCTRSYPGGPLACTLRACIWQGIPRCEAYFDDAPASSQPVIHGFSGPTVLSVNETGTWTIKASDPQNGTLSYRVDWGEVSYDNSTSALSSAGFVQSTTFTHTYAATGVYTVSVTVRDSQGLEAKTTTTVSVQGSNTSAQFYVSPQSGPAPLTVTFRAPGGSSCVDGPDYRIDFGDGVRAMTQSCSTGLQTLTHTYTQEGTYQARLYRIPSGFGSFPVDRTPQLVATQTITVSYGSY